MTKRSSFNVSLQRKHNKVVLGPLIERSEKEGSVISDIIVEYVEKALDYEKVMGLNKVMQTYKLIQNMVTAQYGYGTEEYHRRIEDVLKRIIRIDGNELSMFLSDPAGYSGGDSITPLSVLPILESSPPPVESKAMDSFDEGRGTKNSTQSTAQASANIEEDDEDDERELELERQRQKRAEERKRKKEEKEALLQKQKEPEDDDDDLDDIDIESLNTGALFND